MIRLLRHNNSPLIPIVAVALAIALGLSIGWFGLVGAAAWLVIAAALVVFAWPETAFIASLGTIIIGQLVRIPIAGGESAVILNDLLLPVLIAAWLLRRLGSGRWPIPSSSLTMPITAVLVMFGISLLVNRESVTASELQTGALYAIRWVEYLFVLWMGFEYVRTQARARRYLVLLMWSGIILSMLGFIQLRLFPDFSFMVPQGWDPHVGRLLSTWFDPNFLAGYLALLVTIALGIAVSKPFVEARWWWAAIAIMTVAIVFTFSRSGYVALAAGAGFVTLMRARALFFLGILVFAAIVLLVPRVQERVVGIRSIDETAQLRLVSWSNAFSVIEDHPWTGVGYNLYSYVQVKYGFLDTAKEHSASGSDSSLLTIWVTTGIFGLLAYLWLLAASLREAICAWHAKHLDPTWKGFGLGLTGALLGLFLHSLFVNSLVYPHMMQVAWLCLAIAIMVRQGSPQVVRQPERT